VGTPEQDLERHLDDIEDDQHRARAIIRQQEEWDWIIFYDKSEDRDFCYLIFERSTPTETYVKTIRCGYGYATPDSADQACADALDECAADIVDNP
jgi:hypothetical protein